MKTKTIRIVDLGRGPQIEGHRLTVMDVFYYLHRGHDFKFIQCAMPSLTQAEFDAVVEYIDEHRDELVDLDRRVEAQIQRTIAGQEAEGLRQKRDESAPVEVRAARLKEKLHRQLKEQAERNGGHGAR